MKELYKFFGKSKKISLDYTAEMALPIQLSKKNLFVAITAKFQENEARHIQRQYFRLDAMQCSLQQAYCVH